MTTPTLLAHGLRITTLAAACTAALMAGCATTNPPSATTAQVPAPSTQATPAAPGTAPPAASRPAAAAPAAAPGTSPGAAAVRPAPVPGAPAPFAEVTRDAKRADGYLPVWTRDDKTWIEIPAALLDKPMFFGSSVSGGIGMLPFVPGLTGREQVVVLRRVGNTVQLLAKNQLARAPAGTPLAQAVSESYSDSLLGAAPLAAAPHLQSKALLVDAQLLLGGDIANSQATLEAVFRVPYALDRANSSVERVRSLPTGLSITLRQHFAVPRLPNPPVMAPGAPPPNPAALPNPPATLPDARSLFLGQTLNFAPLPAQPMKTREADPRVGYFTTSFTNFGDDKQEGSRTHFIERWRLEKKDPSAAVSEPKEPIRVVLDRNIPDKWRAPLREAALEWNKAFERAGFRNAMTVEQQAADADWSTLEGTRLLAVRWFAQQGPGSTAVGPSQSDPRTGEILRGAAIIDENRVRVFRSRAADGVPRWADTVGGPSAAPAAFAQPFAQPFAACTHAEDTMDEARFGYDLLVERGLLEPDSPEADRYIADALKNVTMHEIGHVLGLRHNFRASVALTPAQLRDRSYTQANGLSASVMEYNAQNLPLAGEPAGDYNMTTLGAYDYWAIEWGYREFADAAAETGGLQALAARSEREPALAYATDEDLANNDPLVNQRDMSNDPLAFAQRQVLLARELLQRTTSRALKPNEDLTGYRRAVSRVLGTLGTSLPFAAKYVGGTYTARAKAGADQPLVVPVPAAQQRAALDLLVAELFSSAAFKFDPRVMSRLGIDQYERFGPNRQAGVDFSLPTAVLGLQRGALDALMSDSLAGRLADAESKVADPKQLLSYAEVQERLSKAVWSELDSAAPAKADKAGKATSGEPGDIDSLRRNLQREHVRRLATGLVRPAPATAADVRAVHRQAALALQTRLTAALAAKRGSSLVRAHLEDSLATLNEALKAPLVKQGV
jgi:hypothetical protein